MPKIVRNRQDARTILFLTSEKFQLLRCLWSASLLLATEKFHHPKLFIGECKYNYLSFGWQKRLYPSDMHIGIFSAVAVPDINGILKH